MNSNIIHIKNMVCPRCIAAVEKILKELDLPFIKVELGQVILKNEPDEKIKSDLKNKLSVSGFELIESGKSVLISKIKSIIIEQIHHSSEPLKTNFSVIISEKLGHDYSYLSRLFSSVEGITIEKYIARQKIEKVKELIFYDELSLQEIAFRLNYSSVAYLVSQFKKETGMTTRTFKESRKPGHTDLSSL